MLTDECNVCNNHSKKGDTVGMPSVFLELELHREKSVCSNLSVLSDERFPQKTKEVTIDLVSVYRTKECQQIESSSMVKNDWK
jgi:hypothetical protein